jgi:FAD binding domain
VTGVEIDTGRRTLVVNAEVTVILCCGGFSENPRLKRDYFGVDIPAFSPPGRAEGDGIRLAQELGADLWHMAAPAYNFGFASPKRDVVSRISLSDFGFVLVDQRGARFECETSLEAYSAARSMATPGARTGEFLRTPTLVNIQGGPRRNSRGQIVRPRRLADYRPIRRGRTRLGVEPQLPERRKPRRGDRLGAPRRAVLLGPDTAQFNAGITRIQCPLICIIVPRYFVLTSHAFSLA